MDLLVLLASEGGRLLSRDEIIERIWGRDVFFDTDNGINTAIRKIRRALGENPENPRYIETVQGKGYRFKATDRGTSQISSSGVQRPPIMLAVLPFENLSADPAQEYFSDGLTEETIMRLGKLAPDRMGVIARTSSMAYKRTTKSVRQIGQELGVDYVLEGSVRREPECVRITAQLIRVSDQIHLWAENFDRSPDNVLEVQGEVGTAIAAQIKLRLSPEESRQLRELKGQGGEAFDLYLRGRYHQARVVFSELQKAISYYRRAAEVDPNYVLPYTGLAESFLRLPITSDVPAREAFEQAKSAVKMALHLDPDSAEAHASDAGIKFWFDWEFAAAESAARHAIALNGNYPMAHLYLAHILSNMGRHDEALKTIAQARLLDPLSLIINALHGEFLYQAGTLDESVRQLHSTLDLEPRFWVAHICLAKSYEWLGMYQEALVACERAREYSGGNTEALSLAGYIYAISGEQAKAEHNIQKLQHENSKRYVPPYNLALVFAGLKQTNAALDCLQRAYEDRDVHMTFLLDHKWDVLRSEPRFRDLLHRCGFASAAQGAGPD